MKRAQQYQLLALAAIAAICAGAYLAQDGTAQSVANPEPVPVQCERTQTDAAGAVTWVYPKPYPTTPIVVAIAESGTAGSTDVINAQLDGVATPTQAKIKVTRTQQSVVALLGLTILSLPASVGVTNIDVCAKGA